MDKQTAEELMELLLSLSPYFDQAGELTGRIQDEDEQRTVRKSLGDLMGHLYTDVMIPIIRQYPELDPDK